VGVAPRRLLLRERRQRRARWAQPEPYWTRPQRDFFASDYRLTVWRGANGIGKSQGMAGLCKKALGGELHWQRPGPQTVILTGNTWTQLGSTLKYLWQWIDRRWFRKKIEYQGGGLKGQKLAVYDIVSGPAKGGEFRLGTFRAENLAGPRADVVVADEPLPENVYNELWPRLLGRDGRMYMGFTVTLGTAGRTRYLWEMVDNTALPHVGELVTPLSLDAVTPRGSPVAELPWMSLREIQQFEAGLSRLEVDMRMGRTRAPAFGEAYFSAWGPHLVGDCDVAPRARLSVGVDHGSRPGKQRAVLVAVHGQGLAARVWVLGEYKASGRSTDQDDARGILDMIAKAGERAGVELGPRNVDQWVGDRAHHGDRRGGKKSNRRLLRAMAAEMGLDTSQRGWTDKLPPKMRHMQVPYKADGSHWDGMEVLHRLMVGERPRIRFAPDTMFLQQDIEEWDGSLAADQKDGIDALRYIAVPMVEGKTR
jgi:hypothetical protein